jgi:hypothetical protein
MLAAALYNRFMGTATIVTVQEFLALPEVDGRRIELIGGEVVCMGRASKGHECVKANLNALLIAWIIKNPGFKLLPETTFELSEYDSPIPDLSVYNRSRKTSDTSGWFQGAPEVAIEVVSSEKASLLEKKFELYLPTEANPFGLSSRSSRWSGYSAPQVNRDFSIARRHLKILLYCPASAHQCRPSSKAFKLESI